MAHGTSAQDLRSLLAVAAKLRALAGDVLCHGDKTLYLMAAEALEKRAEWLAVTLPDARPSDAPDPRLHQPVDMRV